MRKICLCVLLPMLLAIDSIGQQYQGPAVLQNYGRFATNSNISQSSGLALDPNGIHFWTHNDQGNPSTKIYKFALATGTAAVPALDSVNLMGTTNLDWEDMTKDSNGNLYVCQTGKNCNDKSDPVECPGRYIYKIHKTSFAAINAAGPGGSVVPETFYFKYPLTGYDLNDCDISDTVFVNCEATFFYNGFLYLLTKSIWSKHTNNCGGWNATYTYLFKLSLQPGSTVSQPLVAQYVSMYNLKASPTDTLALYSVTGAAISPDNKVLSLLTYGRLWQFRNFVGDSFFAGNASYTAHATSPTALVSRGYEGIEFREKHYVILSVDGDQGRISGFDLDSSALWVRNTNDAGTGSLRACVASAGSGDTVRCIPALANQPITLQSPTIRPNADIMVMGSGPLSLLYVQGGSNTSIIEILAGLHIKIQNVRLRGAFSQAGAVLKNHGSLSLQDVTIHTASIPDLYGIFNDGAVVVSGACNLLRD